MRLVSASVLSAAVLLAAASPALAMHGKVGLWEITTTINGPGMMSQLSPAVQAQMRAHGVKLPSNNSITVQHCMTADEVTRDKLPPMPKRGSQECKVQNMKVAGQSVSADMVCSGKNMQGTGHFTMTYDSPEHYSGTSSFSMTANGHPMSMSNRMEGRWVSASCGNVKH